MLTTAAPGTSSKPGETVGYVFTPEQIPLAWEELESFIEKSIEKSFGMMTTRQCYDMLCAGQAAAFATSRDGKLRLVLVVRPVEYASYRVARIIAMAGTGLREAHRFVDALEAWAVALGCVELEGWCRPAVTRFLRRLGWQPKLTLVVRDLRRKLQ